VSLLPRTYEAYLKLGPPLQIWWRAMLGRVLQMCRSRPASSRKWDILGLTGPHCHSSTNARAGTGMSMCAARRREAGIRRAKNLWDHWPDYHHATTRAPCIMWLSRWDPPSQYSERRPSHWPIPQCTTRFRSVDRPYQGSYAARLRYLLRPRDVDARSSILAIMMD